MAYCNHLPNVCWQHYCIIMKSKLRLLLKKGCLFKVRDKDQLTASDLALKHAHPHASPEDRKKTRQLFTFEHEVAPIGLGASLRDAARRGDQYTLHQLAAKWRGYHVLDEGDASDCNVTGESERAVKGRRY